VGKNKGETMTSQPIIKQKTRILTPQEYFKLREQLKPAYKLICDVLLNTGMRVEEFWEFTKNPNWYRAARRCIDMPQGSIKKTRALHQERTIVLTLNGCDAVEALRSYTPTPMTRTAMRNALLLAAEHAGLSPEGINPKMFRKTCISWLIAAGKDSLLVSAHAGHTLETMRVHYLGISFEKQDLEDIEKYMKGWGER
jgi:integrase